MKRDGKTGLGRGNQHQSASCYWAGEAELEEYGKGPPCLAKYTGVLPRGAVSSLEFAQEDFSGVLRSRVDGASCWPTQACRHGWMLVPLPFRPELSMLSVVLDVQNSLRLWQPTDSPLLEEPHTAGCS